MSKMKNLKWSISILICSFLFLSLQAQSNDYSKFHRLSDEYLGGSLNKDMKYKFKDRGYYRYGPGTGPNGVAAKDYALPLEIRDAMFTYENSKDLFLATGLLVYLFGSNICCVHQATAWTYWRPLDMGVYIPAEHDFLLEDYYFAKRERILSDIMDFTILTMVLFPKYEITGGKIISGIHQDLYMNGRRKKLNKASFTWIELMPKY